LNPYLTWVVWIAGIAVVVAVVSYIAKRVRRRALNPTDLYIRALDALLAGDEAAALELLKDTVRLDSNNIHAYLKLGTLLRKSGETHRAVRIHREVTLRRRIDRETRETALRELALDFAAQGNAQKALATLEELRKENSKNAFAYDTAARLMEERGQWDQAYELRRQLHRMAGDGWVPSLATFQAHVGREHARRGDYKKAQDHFKEAFRRDKRSLAAHLFAGDLKYQQGKLKESVELWKNLIRHHPHHAPLVYKRLEKAYFDLGQFETMMDVYEDVLRTRPEDARTLLAAAQLYEKKGDLDEAERLVSRVLETDAGHRQARLYLALIHAERDDPERAREILEDLLERELRAMEGHVCRECGNQSEEVLWRCPACGGWETYAESER